jgi:hypothetical protein
MSFDNLELLLRAMYDSIDSRDDNDEMQAQIEHILSMCALRRECSEINEVDP